MKYYNDDLLTAPCRVIAHGCNARGVMGKGVAKAIKDAYPSVFKVYRDTFTNLGLKLGDVVWAGIPSLTRIVANVIIQSDYAKRYNSPAHVWIDYDAFAKGMLEVASFCKTSINEDHVGIPLIGAGLAGGDWKTIARILRSVEYEHGFEFRVYIPDQAMYEAHKEI